MDGGVVVVVGHEADEEEDAGSNCKKMRHHTSARDVPCQSSCCGDFWTRRLVQGRRGGKDRLVGLSSASLVSLSANEAAAHATSAMEEYHPGWTRLRATHERIPSTHHPPLLFFPFSFSITISIASVATNVSYPEEERSDAAACSVGGGEGYKNGSGPTRWSTTSCEKWHSFLRLSQDVVVVGR